MGRSIDTESAARLEEVHMVAVSTLPRRMLGRTGLEVSVLGFGTAPLGDLFVRLPDDIAIATIERAFTLGINLLELLAAVRARSCRTPLWDGAPTGAAPPYRALHQGWPLDGPVSISG